MGSVLDRTEILRKQCPDCKSKGYVIGQGGAETICATCGGGGSLEKEVPYKFDGERSQEELDEIFKEE